MKPILLKKLIYTCANMMTMTMTMTIPIIQIPDCFVYSWMKLNNGKDGHGERRLYTGDDNNVNNHITTKPWKIIYAENYVEDFGEYLDNDDNFSQNMKNKNRKQEVVKYMLMCNEQLINIAPQNGVKDVVRYYIGPDKTNKENINLFDTLRKTLVAKQTCIQLEETLEHFVCNIVNINSVERKKQKKASKAADECLNYRANMHCIEIQTETNGGEFQLRNPKNGYFWPVDGYHNCALHKCSGDKTNPCSYNNHLWEFQGDYWHGNPTKYSGDDLFHNKMYSTKQLKDLEKKQFYEENGYVVNIIWESEWTNEKKALKIKGETWLYTFEDLHP